MATNRFTVNNNENTNLPDPNEILLNILKSEFPDDPVYKQGTLSQAQTQITAKPLRTTNTRITTTRNDANFIDVYTDSPVKTYTEYTIDKNVPTADENTIDNLLDEEWQFFIEPQSGVYKSAVTRGKFLIPTEVQLNPIDFHHAYISSGPENLDDILASVNSDTNSITSQVFCVYYIDNDTARPIPNYKTLEVMLVERGLSYKDIAEATNDQQRQFDMVFDGVFTGDTTSGIPNPAEEFKVRKMPDRTNEWNERVRFQSGYRPLAPFKRDPGDYLKPQGLRSSKSTDIFRKEDPSDLYFDTAFQWQTNREMLRERYEGKLVIKNWPFGYDETVVINAADVEFDDLVNTLRMMTNGFWKQVLDPDVLRLYASRANITLNRLDESDALGPLYGENGYINLLVELNEIEPLQITQDTIAEASTDTENLIKPVWNDFPHIIEADRLDYQEFLNYIDYYSNNGAPFDIEHLKPYEPAGSIKYYPTDRVDELNEQAILQNALTNVKEQILELWPTTVSMVENLEMRLKGVLQQSFSDYFRAVYDADNGDLYNMLVSRDKWRFVKKDNVKDDDLSLLRIVEKNWNITRVMDRSEEDRIVNVGKWGLVPDLVRDTRINNISNVILGTITAAAAASALIGAATLSTATAQPSIYIVTSHLIASNADFLAFAVDSAGLKIEEYFSGIQNTGLYELPRNNDNTRDKKFIKQNWYINLMISLEADRRLLQPTRDPVASMPAELREPLLGLNMYERIDFADKYMPELRDAITEAKDLLVNIDDIIANSNDLNEVQDIYTSIKAIHDLFRDAEKGTFQYCVDTKEILDSYIQSHVYNIYQGLEYLRSVVYNKVGLNDNNFGIIYPDSVKNIISKWIPSANFDYYIPEKWEG